MALVRTPVAPDRKSGKLRSTAGAVGRAPTKEGTGNDLRRNVQVAFQGVRQCVSYFDTIQILMARGIWKDLFRQLQRQSGAVIPQKSLCLRYPWLVRIHQPTRCAIQTLLDAREDFLVNRVDVAYDFETCKLVGAWDLHSFLRLHLTQPWHGAKMEMKEVADHTTYFRRAGQPRNIVIYSRKSKLLKKPSLHLEIRMVGRLHCRRYGMGSLPDLLSFGGAEAATLLTRNCRFTAFNPGSIRRGFEKLVSAKMCVMSRLGKPMPRRDLERLLRRHMAAVLQTSDHRPDVDTLWEASAQNWIDRFPAIAKPAAIHADWAAALANKEIDHSFFRATHSEK